MERMNNYNDGWVDDPELKHENEYKQFFDPRYLRPEQQSLLQERNIVLAVVFSIITIGIYYIYWMNRTANTIKIIDGDYSGAALETVFFS